MNKPPDQKNNKNSPALNWDKSKCLNFTQNGPIYLLMKRTNSSDTLSFVSPFLLKKAIDYTCDGEVEECKKLMSGNILIKARNCVQANKLTTLTALSDAITVEVTDYKSLNQTKGVIYSNDLRGVTENEIVSELHSQSVCDVKKIVKYVNKQNVETGLLILTFASSTLPSDIKIGYQKINVRPYIPLPIRCNNCQQFGHIAKFCKNNKKCFHCAKDFHLDPELVDEVCINEINCINCIQNKLNDTKHTSKDKKCPIFIKHKELQTIKTIEKVDNKTAYRIYSQRHQQDKSSYTDVVISNNNTSSFKEHRCTNSNVHHNSTVPTSQITNTKPISTNIDAITDSDSDLLSLPSTSANTKNTNVKILPRNTPKRLQAKLKANSKPSKTTLKTKQLKATNSVNDNVMEL